MKRYIISFIIAISIYTSLIASSFYIFDEDSLSKSSKKSSTQIQRVKVSLVEPIKKAIQKKEQKKKIEKSIVKKKDIPTKKEIAKKIEKPQKKEIKKVVKEQSTKTTLTPKKTASKTINKDKNIESDKLKELQNRYFAMISETINKNKSYPKRAVLRGMQDDIKIEFIISPSGELLSFFIVDGKNIFHNSAKNAVEKSFPLIPPSGVLSSNTKLKLTISYRLN